VFHLTKSNGRPFVTKWLKANAVLLQQAVGGHKHKATQDLGVAVSRTRSGLPRVIPREMRARIRKKERVVIIAWLTLFSLYRIIDFRGKLKLSTITNPGSVIPGEYIVHFKSFIQVIFWPLVAELFPCGISRASLEKTPKGKSPLVTSWAKDALQPSFFPILKSGTLKSHISTSVKSLKFSANAWMKDGVMLSVLKTWASLVEKPQPQNIRHQTKSKMQLLLELISTYGSDWSDLKKSSLRPDRDSVPLGKLSLKPEAAGKIRVFAIVDPWTQWLLYPLHEALFALLRRIPTDGTFDQYAPVKRLKLTRKTPVYSFDLSAATDRLPLMWQKIVLGPVLGLHLAEAWGDLLTKRGYHLKLGKVTKVLHYAVGQPMGALSSWAMLALTHHAIVQWAAYRCWRPESIKYSSCEMPPKIVDGRLVRFTWFQGYAVLGDDVIITDPSVAAEYVKLMKVLGVEIGLAKSLISPCGVGEFAKKYFIPADASPISLKEVAVSLHDVPVLCELASKRKQARLADILSFLGYGYKAIGSINKRYSKLPSRLRNWLLTLTFPGQAFGKPSMDAWLASLSSEKISNRSLTLAYAQIGKFESERISQRFDSLAPYLAKMWEIKMYKRNTNKGLPVADWMKEAPLLYEVWSQHSDVGYEVSQLKKRWIEAGKVLDTKQRFYLLKGIQDDLDLLPTQDPLITGRSEEERWSSLMKFIDAWYQIRSNSS
jgi:hypothetical protein